MTPVLSRPRTRAHLLVAAGWIASTIVACAPARFVPRPPGLEVFRDGLSIELREREGDPSKKQPVRYGVQIASDDDPAIVRASVGTSDERCAPGETPLAVDVEDLGGTDKHRGSLSARYDDTFGVTVPAGAPAPAVDFALNGTPSGSSTCVRVPVEGDEIAWRRLHQPVAGRASYSVTIPTGTVALVSGAQMGEVGVSEWWGPVRGTAFLGAGAAYCPDPRCGGQPENTSGHFAATGGAGIDAFPLLGSFSLGAGVRYASTVAWMGQDGSPDPTLVHGLFGVLGFIFGPVLPRRHGAPAVPGPGTFEIDVPVGLWTTTPGKGSEQSFALGVDFAISLGIGER